MSDYSMPVLSEQEKLVLIDNAMVFLIRVKYGNIEASKFDVYQAQIALAALTAKPTDFLAIGDDDAEYNGIRHFSFRPNTVIDLYRSPPVPVKQEGGQ